MNDAGVIAWLMAGDPAIRWQVMRDIQGGPETEWRAERALVEHEGWGARLLACQDDDGQWAGGAFVPAGFDWDEWKERGQPWTATTYALSDLREFGLQPGSDRVRRMVGLIGTNCHWDHAGEAFWDGEVEECINGRTVADGAYFGADVAGIVARLLHERQADGGWNCERCNGSVRSSFDTTINVLEGLLEFERATGTTAELRAARKAGEAFLLERGLFRRLSTGEPTLPRHLDLTYPNRWRYDVLRAVDYFRAAGGVPDPRLGDAIAYLQSRQLTDGRWPLDARFGGRVWFEMEDGVGAPSRWITLRALRVLRWWVNKGLIDRPTSL